MLMSLLKSSMWMSLSLSPSPPTHPVLPCLFMFCINCF
uniref:Uncharacterized protein n=1 Tax=Anguilla anguilla TaxID=7936 RepID=A0A0E9QVY7_ANGAN